MGDPTFIALLEIVRSDHFDIALSRSTFKHANRCKNVEQRNEEKFMIENILPNLTFQKQVEPLIELAVHYKQVIINVLQDQVSLASLETDFMFCLAFASTLHLTWKTHSRTRSYFHIV